MGALRFTQYFHPFAQVSVYYLVYSIFCKRLKLSKVELFSLEILAFLLLKRVKASQVALFLFLF